MASLRCCPERNADLELFDWHFEVAAPLGSNTAASVCGRCGNKDAEEQSYLAEAEPEEFNTRTKRDVIYNLEELWTLFGQQCVLSGPRFRRFA
jgi:hypothetical protein